MPKITVMCLEHQNICHKSTIPWSDDIYYDDLVFFCRRWRWWFNGSNMVLVNDDASDMTMTVVWPHHWHNPKLNLHPNDVEMMLRMYDGELPNPSSRPDRLWEIRTKIKWRSISDAKCAGVYDTRWCRRQTKHISPVINSYW